MSTSLLCSQLDSGTVRTKKSYNIFTARSRNWSRLAQVAHETNETTTNTVDPH